MGLTRGSTAAHIARAVVASMAYQTRDVMEAMLADAGVPLRAMRVDGGAAGNDALMQFQADQLGVPGERPRVRGTPAPGAANLGGHPPGVVGGGGGGTAAWGRGPEVSA